jgi:hypothetical protein
MALLSFVESAPRAYRLKVGNADLFRNSTEPGTIPAWAALYLALHSCMVNALADVPHKPSAVTITRLRIIIIGGLLRLEASAAGAKIKAYPEFFGTSRRAECQPATSTVLAAQRKARRACRAIGGMVTS